MKTELEEILNQPLGASEWVTIPQSHIDQFADLTQDHQFIHVDKDRAKYSAFGTTIAHGMLTLSVAVPLILPFFERFTRNRTLVNYGSDKVRFLEPVPSGGQIRAQPTLVNIEQKPEDRWLLTIHTEIDIRHKTRPALSADLLLLML